MDFGFLRTLPDIKVFYAGTKRDLRAILEERYDSATSPMIILHPYELISPAQEEYLPQQSTPLDLMECICPGSDGVIIAAGNRLTDAVNLNVKLLENQKQNYVVYNLRWINPLPVESLRKILSEYEKVVTLEEGVRSGGIGCAINDFVRSEKLDCQIFVNAIDDGFLPAGDKKELSELAGLDVDSILNNLEKFLG